MLAKEGTSTAGINPSELFRMPWTMADNSMSWLEPTRKCNITCDACFASNDPQSEKSLIQIENEVKSMLRLRSFDGMLIGGGEPLTHPQIVDVVKIVKAHKAKPVLITNGVGLEPGLVHELKKAGIFGFNFHIDSHQSRPGWRGKSEKELNELRQYFADMIKKEGGLVCGFISTIFPDTIEYVPDIVRWAVQNIDRVRDLLLVVVRFLDADGPFDYYINDKKVNISETVYCSPQHYENLTLFDIYSCVKKVIPDFKLCAYLGGTIHSHSLKWAIGCRIGSTKKTYGNLGAKSMELIQNMHHALKGRYLSFTKPSLNRKARIMFLLGLFDWEVRKAIRNYVLELVRNPLQLFKRLYTQKIVIEQPIDILPTGELDIAEGCPDMTLWKDRLIPNCFLEFYLRYGGPMRIVPKSLHKTDHHMSRTRNKNRPIKPNSN